MSALRELADDLRAGRSTLAWAMRWAPTGVDPLPYAWDESEDPQAMHDVLRYAQHPAWRASLRFTPSYATSDWRYRLCDAIRRVVPTLTLADLRGGR